MRFRAKLKYNDFMKNVVLKIVFLTSAFVFGQISKSASIRDFRSFKEYRYFLEYKDSLNKINNVKLDIEYLEEFKKIYKRTDSLNQVDLKERDQLEKEEYIRETKLEKYLGTYRSEERRVGKECRAR